ncbi:type A2 lantipeptide [Streptomyces sp. WG-D5]
MSNHIETLEISDADLDNVSGGLVGGLVGQVTNTVDGIVPVSGTVSSVTNTVEGLTGVNAGAVTGLVGGVTAGL